MSEIFAALLAADISSGGNTPAGSFLRRKLLEERGARFDSDRRLWRIGSTFLSEEAVLFGPFEMLADFLNRSDMEEEVSETEMKKQQFAGGLAGGAYTQEYMPPGWEEKRKAEEERRKAEEEKAKQALEAAQRQELKATVARVLKAIDLEGSNYIGFGPNQDLNLRQFKDEVRAVCRRWL